jgi:hypothetical protein
MASNITLKRKLEDGRLLFQKEGTYFGLTQEDIIEIVRLAADPPTVSDEVPHLHDWQRDRLHPRMGAARCILCHRLADAFYCPASPDHLCHYANGDEDCCDYCAQPRVRK